MRGDNRIEGSCIGVHKIINKRVLESEGWNETIITKRQVPENK